MHHDQDRILAEAILQANKHLERLAEVYKLRLSDEDSEHLFSLLVDGYYIQLKKNWELYLDTRTGVEL